MTVESNAPEPEESADGQRGHRRRMGLTYALGRMVVTPLARLVYRPRVEGKDLVPKTGPVIFASNHLSFIDSIAIPVAAAGRLNPLIAAAAMAMSSVSVVANSLRLQR